MTSATHLGLLLMCLLVSHTQGSRHFTLSFMEDSGVSPSATTSCPSITSGFSTGNKLPVVHRLNPCSPLGGSKKQGGKTTSLNEIFHRDGLRLRYLAEAQQPGSSATQTTTSGLSTLPATQNIVRSVPGVYEYTVVAGYGTPAQQLPLRFDTGGISFLQCKPCFPGAPCSSMAFDPSTSSTFHRVPCGSPDCKGSCSHGACAFTFKNSTFVFGNGTIVTDTLTLSPSLVVEKFSVHCMQMDNRFRPDDLAVGHIDLSKSRNSLVSRILPSLSPDTATFSYCLPADTDKEGFLSIAPTHSEYYGISDIKYVPLVSHPTGPNFYFVDLVAITIKGKDLPFPPAAFRGNGTLIEAHTSFSYLNPDVYAALREEFRRSMAQYPRAPAFNGLDTCYNFTGLSSIRLPDIAFRFGNGVVMDLDDRQFMYFFREHQDEDFPFGCLAFAPAPDKMFPWNIIGVQMQRTKEVVYDVPGRMVAFVPSRCGLR